MRPSRSLVNGLSLSRIAIALLFVLCFQKHILLYWASVALCILALTTDLLDGYFARQLKIASIHGRLYDSLGDKAFYIAVIIGFNAQGFLGSLVSWALIVRELALYITRILFIDRLSKIEQAWPLTKWHGYLIYVTIILGLIRMYGEIRGSPIPLHPYMQVSAYAALAFGIATIVHFLRTE